MEQLPTTATQQEQITLNDLNSLINIIRVAFKRGAYEEDEVEMFNPLLKKVKKVIADMTAKENNK